jgi:peptidoglycan/xylan/chitin deacetylase (PgdA/CDA1 family)
VIKISKFFKNCTINFVIFLCIISVLAVCVNFDYASAVSVESYEAIYRGNINNKNVSLMINVYWGDEYVLDMLNILNQNGAKATFFVGGCWASAHLNTLQKIIEGGHELANHGYYHKDHKTISQQRNYEEIKYTHDLILQLVGVDMTLFMPPSGSFGLTTLQVAKGLNYKTIMWSKDTIDWRDKDENLIFSRATKNMQNGDLILMHPTQCTLNALQNIVTAYQNAGYNLVTVTENLE